LKDTLLWLQLPKRHKPDAHSLYSTIQDLGQWVDRVNRQKAGEQARLFYSLLVEVNSLDISVQARFNFLNLIAQAIRPLVGRLEKKFAGLSLPLDENKVKYVELVQSFWKELELGYKIIIEDLSDGNFLSGIMSQKNLSLALFNSLEAISYQIFYQYQLYSQIDPQYWRELHQLFHYAQKKKVASKVLKLDDNHAASIEKRYLKLMMFSLSNPYHLTVEHMRWLWNQLDEWVYDVFLVEDHNKFAKKEISFSIDPFSARPPSLQPNEKNNINDPLFFLNDKLWGVQTNKLSRTIQKKNADNGHYAEHAALVERLLRIWSGDQYRRNARNELIDTVNLVLGCSNISNFLSHIEIEPKLLNLHSQSPDTMMHLKIDPQRLYKALMLDESSSGYRFKLILDDEQRFVPSLGEVIAIKHNDDSIRVGFLRWLKENNENDIELGVEHLSSLAEPVELLLNASKKQNNGSEKSEKSHILESFVFPGGEAENFRPVLFTNSFVERYANSQHQDFKLVHKTGTLDIVLTQKVNEILDYSLFLFEKQIKQEAEEDEVSEKTARFAAIWDKLH
jgi:hypothetical protein